MEAERPAELVRQPPTVEEQAASLKVLRSDFRMASVSQFVNTFKPHIGLEFEIQDLEDDLIGMRSLCIIPQLLGKLLNTLANDRNVNTLNWRVALRRAFIRRGGGINPFQITTQIPIIKEANSEIKTKAEETESAATIVENGAPTNGEAKPDLEAKVEEVISVDAAPVPVETNGLEPVKAGVVKVAAVKSEDVTMTEATEEEKVVEPEFTTVTEDVEWEDVSLESKISAIYSVCEWHMTEPDRFRKHLKWEDDLIWRLEPAGQDANGNNYFILADTRLWFQKVLPPSAALTAAKIASDRAWKIKEARRNIKKHENEVIPKKRETLSRAPPKERNSGSAAKGKGKKRFRDDSDEDAVEGVESDDEEDDDFAAKPVAKAKAKVQEKKKSRNSRGDRSEVWEELPEEWKEKVDVEEDRMEKEGSVGASSNLSSVADEEELVEMDVDEADIPNWLEEHQKEREILDAKGFVEWEAICITLQDWEAFPATLEGTKNREEKIFRDYVIDEAIPWIINEIEERAKAKAAAIEKANAASLKQVALLESQMEVEARSLREKTATTSRSSRASRHSNGDSLPAAPIKGGLETRDDRLKKREDEKKAREMKAEEGVLEESKAMTRGDFVDNPVAAAVEAEYRENSNEESEKEPEPLEEQEYVEEEADEADLEKLEEERLALKEKKRIEREEGKIKREEIALAKKSAKAEPKVKSKPVYLEEEEEPVEEPWYLDCEVCQIAGWNQDDGSSVICCDRCLDWQHLECHQESDKVKGKEVNYDDDDFEFICIKCVADPSRRKQERIAPEIVRPGEGADEGYEDGDEDAVPTSRTASRPRPVRAAPAPAAPKPKPKPASRQPPRQPPTAAPTRAAAPAQAAPAHASAAQTPMDYESLLAMVTNDNAIMLQLPRAYQVHFAEKLNIPLPPEA